MFSTTDLPDVVPLQVRAYELFQWLNDALRTGRIRLPGGVHSGTLPEVLRAWVGRHRGSFPMHLRVSDAALPTFANLFASFLRVSFEPRKGGQQIAGCDCGFCAVFAQGHFKGRVLSDRDRSDTEQFIERTLEALALELGCPLVDAELHRIRIAHEVATYVHAYGHELLRRARFESADHVGLVLWRAIQARNGSATDVTDFLDAERELGDAIRAFGDDGGLSYAGAP